MGNIIAITNRRGKVGKSTTAVNLAVAFTRVRKRILLVDLDSAGSCAKIFGFSKQEFATDIFSTSNHNISLRNSILKTQIKNLELIHIRRLPYLDELKIGNISANEQILKNVLKPASINYDYIIIDCPPHHTGNINAALITADSVLIPVAPGKFSAAAVRKMMAQFNDIRENYNSDLTISGILLTNYEFNNENSFALKKELFKEYPGLIFSTSIPKSANVKMAFENNEPLLLYKPDDRASKAYSKLVDELFERKSLFHSKRK
ncbi:MAG: ParA family protein [Ignavibacteriaceae bacterium]|nr:ParA family protein [Ignavibacteriaceae bacterium]